MANCFEKYNNNLDFLSSDVTNKVRNSTLFNNIRQDVLNSVWENNNNVKVDICNNLQFVSSSELHLQLTKGFYNCNKDNSNCYFDYEPVYEMNICKEIEYPELSNNYLGLDISNIEFSGENEYAQIIDSSLNELINITNRYNFFNYPTRLDFD